MSERTGKCTNFTSCSIAYRKETVTVTGDFVCPECGAPLTESAPASALSGKRMMLAIGGAIAGLFIVGVIAIVVLFFVFRRHEHRTVVAKPTPVSESRERVEATPVVATPRPTTPEPARTPVARSTPAPARTPATPAPRPQPSTPVPSTPESTETTENVQVEQKINPDLGREENRRIKEEVLTRIDAMPALSQADKDKLHDSVRRARGMGRIITIPFAKGQSALSSKNIENLKTAVQAPEVAKLLEDPTVIFVVLGFADKKGDPNANLRLSRARADSALKALRTNCGILNVLHSVGMGGSDLFDAGDQARNRVVEVWAVLP